MPQLAQSEVRKNLYKSFRLDWGKSQIDGNETNMIAWGKKGTQHRITQD